MCDDAGTSKLDALGETTNTTLNHPTGTQHKANTHTHTHTEEDEDEDEEKGTRTGVVMWVPPCSNMTHHQTQEQYPR